MMAPQSEQVMGSVRFTVTLAWTPPTPATTLSSSPLSLPAASSGLPVPGFAFAVASLGSPSTAGAPPGPSSLGARARRRGGHGRRGDRGRDFVVLGLIQGRVERVAALAVVAVDGDALEPHLPPVDVGLLDLAHRRQLRQVDGLADRAGDERLGRR